MRTGLLFSKTPSTTTIGLGLGICLFLHSAVALAQEAPEQDRRQSAAKITQEQTKGAADVAGETDEKRVADSYQPKGIEAGSFLIFPRLEVDATYSDNVFAQEKDKRSDAITRIAPEIRMRSRFTLHELNLRGELEQYLFKKYEDDNRLDANIGADGRLDIQRNWEATGNLSFVNRGEDRGSPDVQQGKSPAETYTTSGQVGTRLQQGRYVFSGDFGFDRRIFDNTETSTGTTINNHDRDRWEYKLRGRGSYEFKPGLSAVLDATVNRRDYDDRVDDNNRNRSSDGYRIEGGIGLDISEVIKGDFVVGYFEQNYKDTVLKDPSGMSVRASFNWTPSRMTVIIPSLERTVQETLSASSSSIVRTGGGLIVRHEFARNIVATFIANTAYEDYTGTSEHSWNYDGKARVIYALSREWYVGGEVGFRSRDSNRAGASYDQVTMLLRVGTRL